MERHQPAAGGARPGAGAAMSINSPLTAAELPSYLDGLVPPRPAELQEMEAWARAHDFPIIGPACGYACYQLARLCGARRVFELGSGYGYSTAWFARAVRENGGGEVHHVVWDQDLSNRARGHLSALGYADPSGITSRSGRDAAEYRRHLRRHSTTSTKRYRPRSRHRAHFGRAACDHRQHAWSGASSTRSTAGHPGRRRHPLLTGSD